MTRAVGLDQSWKTDGRVFMLSLFDDFFTAWLRISWSSQWSYVAVDENYRIC
jgi:hypothetical protein